MNGNFSQSNAIENELGMLIEMAKENDDIRRNDSGDEKDVDEEHSDDGCDDCCNPEAFVPPQKDTAIAPSRYSASRRGDGNTGVKGVIADYHNQQDEKRREYFQQKELNRAMLEKMVFTVKDQVNDPEEEEDDDSDDEDLKRIREQRLMELKRKQQQQATSNSTQKSSSIGTHPLIPRNKVFGYCKQITKEEYVNEIDNEPPHVFVIIHLFQSYIPECILLNNHLSLLASKYKHIKFLKIVATEAKEGYHDEALPSLLVYIGGNLLVSFIPITEDLDRFFEVEDVELLLAGYDIVPQPTAASWNKSLTSTNNKANHIGRSNGGKNKDSDEEDDDYDNSSSDDEY